MKVVFPVFKAENVLDDKVVLFRGKDGLLRPAIGNRGVDPGKFAADMFGMHGFVDPIGGSHLGGDVVEFHTLEVKQLLNPPEHEGLEVVQMPVGDLMKMIKAKGSAVNIFLNLGVRMYCDFRAL